MNPQAGRHRVKDTEAERATFFAQLLSLATPVRDKDNDVRRLQ
jgi:hypothetical protein